MSDSKQILVRFIHNTSPLTEHKAEMITDFFTEKSFFRDEILIQDGTICNNYYFLAKGYVRSYTHDVDGNDVTTSFISPEQIACELFSFFKRIPSKENFQALSDCETLCINFDKLQIAFHSMPEFREFGRAILVNAYAGLKQRMLSMLHETAEERYANLIVTKPDLFQHAPLKTIASYLGVTDTSLSRIRKEFVKKSL
jgi:CRP-like cAMP-binding protein